MTECMDVLIYIMGSVQMLAGFYFLTRFLQKKVRFYLYGLFAILGFAVTMAIPAGDSITEFLVYFLLLTVSGILVCRADWRPVILYAALTIESMQLSYGIVNSLSCIVYPRLFSLTHKVMGIAFWLSESMALVLSILCFCMIYRHFSYCETVKQPYLFMILTPLCMLFFVENYISSVLYGNTVITDEKGIRIYTDPGPIVLLQLLSVASLFCILFAYKKLLQNFRLSVELSLLEQDEYFLNRYVEEAKERYDNTKSFRHDIKNHMTMLKELLKAGETGKALTYIGDMEEMANGLSFPCSTNNPVVDILLENKLGMAKSMGIDVSCSLILPCPCMVRDIDFCVILANALDNAIHACKLSARCTEPYIHVSGRIQGDFILLEIENSFQGNGLFRTGTGISNIRAVAEKYQGTMRIKAQGTICVCSVLLLIPQYPENIPQKTG